MWCRRLRAGAPAPGRQRQRHAERQGAERLGQVLVAKGATAPAEHGPAQGGSHGSHGQGSVADWLMVFCYFFSGGIGPLAK